MARAVGGKRYDTFDLTETACSRQHTLWCARPEDIRRPVPCLSVMPDETSGLHESHCCMTTDTVGRRGHGLLARRGVTVLWAPTLGCDMGAQRT